MKTLRLSTPLRGNAPLPGKLARIASPRKFSDKAIPGSHFTIPERRVPKPPREASLSSLYLRVVRAESMSPGAKFAISGTFPAPDRPQRGHAASASGKILRPVDVLERWQSG